MALVNNLLASWNFDNLTGSDSSGQFIVGDIAGTLDGAGHLFPTSSKEFLLKEDILTNIKLQVDSLETSDSIRGLEEDDTRIDLLNKPTSLKLVLENSMYQIISDEMMNLFSNISEYVFNYSEGGNLYSSKYEKLEEIKNKFYSKVENNSDLEKYIEFYKWIDSSLGYMLEQLKPENSNTVTGLKNTVESHALERNKFKHKLPLTVQRNKTYEAAITVTNNNSLGESNLQDNLSDNIDNIVSSTNVVNKNFKKNYEVIQTAGKQFNNRGDKPNKTVFQTRFSSADKLSDANRDTTNEFSVYNTLNLRALDKKIIFNISQSAPIGTQGDLSQNNFRDNNFVQRNIPYIDENYYNTSSVGYSNIPSSQVQFLHDTNILVDIASSSYETSQDIVEPPLQFNLPLKLNIQMSTGLQEIETLSSYATLLDTFSIRNRRKYSGLLDKIYIAEGSRWFLSRNTFFWKAYNLLSSNFLTINRLERLDVIFPRTDLVGLARVRTKSRYEEEYGYVRDSSDLTNFYNNRVTVDGNFTHPFLDTKTWSENSYNNNSSINRTYWRDDQQDRLRTRGIDTYDNIGSFNCYNFPNLSQSVNNYFASNAFVFVRNDPNIYNSMWPMDGLNNLTYVESGSYTVLSCSLEIVGDLAPYSHIIQGRLLENTGSNYAVPKPQFIYNLFLPISGIENNPEGIDFVINKSYQDGLDCKIKPFYDTYEEFRANIKHKSQNYSIVPEFIASNFTTLIRGIEYDTQLIAHCLPEIISRD